MFLIKIFKFVKGYVIIVLRGSFIERFINICTRRGIQVWDINKSSSSLATMRMSFRDFKKIRTVARKTHTQINIKKKSGLKMFLKKYKHRYALFMGIILFTLSCALFPRFIWRIDIEGCKNTRPSEITETLGKSGLHIGAYKPSLKTPQALRDIIMSQYDNITWAWVYINGSHATVKIEERSDIPVIIDKSTPGNIIALKDGVISSVSVKEGFAAAVKGQAVAKNDIIISGTVTLKDNRKRYVHSIGDVYANTYYKEVLDFETVQTVRVPTGNEKKIISLNIMSYKLNLSNGKIEFENYDSDIQDYTLTIFGKSFPVSVTVLTAKEVSLTGNTLSEQYLTDYGRETAENRVSAKILPRSELISEKTYTEKLNETALRVYTEFEFREYIGAFAPIYPENTEDN